MSQARWPSRTIYGIRVVLDIAVRPAPLWLHRKCPSIDVTDANGNRLYANHRYMDDVGDPQFCAHARRFAEALTSRYAGHPGLEAFGVDSPGRVRPNDRRSRPCPFVELG